MIEKLNEFVTNIKMNLLMQEKNKIIIEKHNKLKSEINNDYKKKSVSEEVWKYKCDNIFKVEISVLMNEHKNEITQILIDLDKIYKSILEASSIIEHVLIFPLKIMKEKHDQDIFIEKIHKKEFLKIIRNDLFIWSLIEEINSKDYNIFNDLKNLIKNYENDIGQIEIISDIEDFPDNSENDYLSDDSYERKYDKFFAFDNNLLKFNEYVKLSVK